MLLICYASNASICSRAGGMDESSLRRHIRKLSSLGLVQRHDSATGKRFPLKRGGKVLDAFGIDLSPAFRSAERLQRQLNTIQAQEEERRALRSETLSLRRRALEAITQMDEDLRGFLAGITNLMRRKTTTIQQIATVRDRLLKLLAAASNQAPPVEEQHGLPAGNRDDRCEPPAPSNRPTSSEAGNLPASDGQNTRPVESPTLNKIKEGAGAPSRSRQASGSYRGLLERYPNAGCFLPQADPTRETLLGSLRGLGLSLGLKDVPYGDILQALGLERFIAVLDRMVERVESIAHPQSYFESTIMREITDGA